MRFVFATWPEVDYQGVVLGHEKARDRLLSFAFTQVLPKGFLDHYVTEGYAPDKPKEAE